MWNSTSEESDLEQWKKNVSAQINNTVLTASFIIKVESLLQRPGLTEMSEQWRKRRVEDDVMADVYDGQIWKDFLKYKGTDFLNAPREERFK